MVTCPLRSKCVAGKKGKGRTVSLHPKKPYCHKSRAFQQSPAFAEYRRRRQVVEHRLASHADTTGDAVPLFRTCKDPFPATDGGYSSNLTLVAVKMEMMKVARCMNTVLFSQCSHCLFIRMQHKPIYI